MAKKTEQLSMRELIEAGRAGAAAWPTSGVVGAAGRSPDGAGDSELALTEVVWRSCYDDQLRVDKTLVNAAIRLGLPVE